MNTILIGYRCCGKTSVGKLLADSLSCDFADTDNIIETRCKAAIEKIVADKGWDYFRQMETRVLQELVHKKNQVIATGGGMVVAPENQVIMKHHGFVVWLTADVHTIVQRLDADLQNQASRPRFTTRSLLSETRDILARRVPIYEELACMTVDTTAHSPEEIAGIIKRRHDHVRI
ncbi:MAG: shikimate kinase [Desulfotignum sp.]